MRAKRLTYSQVEFLCEQLAMILGSGMSVSEGLGLLCADSDDRVLVSACNEISSEVDRGEPLSQAMRSSGRFPEYAVDMVALGEMSGKLEDVLRGLAEYYEERDEIRRMLRSAVLHPMVLLLMMTVVIIVLVVMVIPMFGDIFSQFDSSVSATVQHTVDMAYQVGLIIMPFTRGISEKLALADLTKAVCVTVSAGVSPAEMMLHSDIKSFITDGRIKKKYEDCEKRVIEGESFPDAIISSGFLPPLYARSLKLGYSSGSFESVWRRISGAYSEAASRSLMNITAVIEPAIIIILGLIIGAILLMLMIPLMNIMSVLG